MLRTCMFVPGDKDRHLEKVGQLTADAFIFDLEDAVAEENKEYARHNVKKFIENTAQTTYFVRVNNVESKYFLEDLREIVDENLTGIVLPMTNNREDIVIADYLLSQMEKINNLKVGSVSIIPIIETASGLLNAFDIASESKRIRCLAFGAEDFMLNTNIIESGNEQEQLLYARSKLVIESIAAGVDAPIDSVYPDFMDEEGLKNTAKNGKKLGFQGKLAIHPNQIKVLNQIFSPSEKEIKEAGKIVEEFDKALLNGSGTVQIEGKMIDAPIVERAKKVLRTKENLKLNFRKEGE